MQTQSQFYYEPWIHVVQWGVTPMAGIPAEEYGYMTIFRLRYFQMKQSQSFSGILWLELDCERAKWNWDGPSEWADNVTVA